MPYEKTLPDGSPILTESQFAEQYIAALTAAGSNRPKTVDVVRYPARSASACVSKNVQPVTSNAGAPTSNN